MQNTSKKIIRTTNILALVLSVSVAVILPLGYFILSYQHQSAVLETEAEGSAFFVTQLINANPEFWRYSQHRLEETLSLHLSNEYEESRRIVDLDNKLIASNSVPVQPPFMTRAHDLFDSGAVVARIEVSSSMKPLLNTSALFGILGLILGSAGFLCFKIFPFRALSDTLKLLYESEEKFRAITTTAVDGIIVMDNKGIITYWNPAAERIFGYTHDEAFGKELHLFIAPQEYHEKYRKGFDGFKSTGQGPAIGKTLEFTAIKKDGTQFPIEVSTSTMKIKGEWHAVGLVHDISARKKADMDSYNSQQMLRLVLDNIPQRVFWKDRNLNYLGCNRACALDAGMPGPDEMIGKNDFDLSWKENAEIYQKDDKHVMETAESKINYEEYIRKFDGSIRWVNTNKVPLHDKTGKVIGVLGTYEDITDKKDAERDLAEVYEMVKDKAEISGSLLQLVETLNSSLEEKELVINVLNLAPKYMGFDRMSLFYYEDQKGLTLTGSYGLTPHEEGALSAKSFNQEDYSAVEMIMKGEIIIFENGGASRLLGKELVDMLNISSGAIVPVSFRGKVTGAIYGDYTTVKTIDQRDLTLLKALAHWMGIAYQNSKLFKDMENLLINTITTLAHTIDAKSPWTKGHSERVTRFAVEIAMEMGLREKDINHIKLCGILHDIGKIGTYDVVLDKPGKLTDEEYELVKKHPEKGAEILTPIKQLKEIVPGILYHHERYDGKGYPFGIKGNDIPLCASILSVADSFDSMTADRPYRKSPGVEYAIAELKRCSGSQFDPKIVEVFLRVLKRLDETDQIPI